MPQGSEDGYAKIHKIKIMQRILVSLLILVTGWVAIFAADPMSTDYSIEDCLGSAKPYPDPGGHVMYPDTLTPVFVSHVGRHGSRFLSSPKTAVELSATLHRMDSAGGLAPLGKSLLKTVEYVKEISRNRWGALDSLGMAEQRGIASRMFRAYPRLFVGGSVNAISSYSPRCVMSMYEFTHQLCRLDNNIDIQTSSGRMNSTLVRPFDTSDDYEDWLGSKEWQAPYDMFFSTTVPAAPARRLLADSGTLSNDDAVALAWSEYKVLSGLSAMGLSVDYGQFFTPEEMNALWACSNLEHYLRWTATTISAEPALLASDLLLDLIATADSAAVGKAAANVELRFGHAETLMPLLSLLRLQGCYYMTNYFDTVALHWRDFDVVPMAANLQMVMFKTSKGAVYVRFDLNERPVPLLPGSDEVYVPWQQARDYLMHCLPMHLQI